eukprot:1342757-Pleurochrysis_carterae.AAC.4
MQLQVARSESEISDLEIEVDVEAAAREQLGRVLSRILVLQIASAIGKHACLRISGFETLFRPKRMLARLEEEGTGQQRMGAVAAGRRVRKWKRESIYSSSPSS